MTQGVGVMKLEIGNQKLEIGDGATEYTRNAGDGIFSQALVFNLVSFLEDTGAKILTPFLSERSMFDGRNNFV